MRADVTDERWDEVGGWGEVKVVVAEEERAGGRRGGRRSKYFWKGR